LARRLGNVDFIYGHEILGAVAGEIAAQNLGVPLVTRFQGTDLCFLLKEPDKIRNFKVRVAAMTVDADLVIMANDGTMGNKVLDFLGVPEDRVRFYMNGVVKDEVIRPNVDAAGIRRKLGIADDEVFILHTGRVFRWKRIDRHLEVLHRVHRQTPKFKAVFIGDGPQMEEAKDLQAALGLQDRVTFLGALPHDQVMDYLNACDIYFSCYDLSNLSNSVIESCVCGNCIVTTAIGGTKDLLTDGVNAVVVEKYEDVDAIAAGMLKVLRDPHERRRLAEGALQRGQEIKTWKERMEMEVADVRAVLAKRRPGRGSHGA
jgi:glycosyltransferase involved in cell wall biosynthesis